MTTEKKYGPTLSISEEISQMKYRSKGESFKEAMTRVADALKDNDEHYKQFREILLNQRFLPAGRVQAAMGAPREVTAFNCFVSGTLEDSMDSIMDKAAEAAQTMRLGGGIGYDFSSLRPRGDHIASLDSRSSGPISFMGIFDAICKTIASAGHRRGAQMGVLRVDHPDIEEFIKAKNNSTTLTQFNVSVGVTDDFMDAVINDKMFDLVFEGKRYKTVRARYLWDEILRSTWDWAEPGVLFIDTINKKNNLGYCETIAATNPCLHPDTKVLTEEGYQRIGSLENHHVNVWNGEEFSTVLVRKTGENQPMKTIDFSDGSSITCTHYHSFYLSDGSKVEAKNLKAGDKLLKHSWPVCEPLDAGDGFFSDEIEAYERGFFSGDGWTKGDKSYIGLYGDKKNLLHKFKNQKSIKEYNITGGYPGTDTTQTKLYLYYGKNYWSKTDTPEYDWTIGARKAWLTGLMDSDGTVTKDGNAQICSKDRSFLEQVKLLLNELGANGSLSPMKDIWRLTIPASYYFSLDLDSRHKPVKSSREATRFLKVVSIEEDEVCPEVFCFTEPKRGMGVFNGVLTGQCGEQPLPPYGACLLGSFNLVKYIDNDNGLYFDYEKLKHDIAPVVRAMDNVIDRTVYPLEAQRREAQNKRRMGLGVTGVANAGEALGYTYGSPEFLEWLEEVMTVIRDTCYQSSISLALEKGPFPLFQADKYLESGFARTLPESLRRDIHNYGIRNSHLLSVAPTGTISLSADNVSSGIEPVFSLSYERTIQTFEGPKVERVEDYGYRVFGVEGKTANELSVFDHVKVLNTASRFVDSACSKTCNVGDEVTWDQFKDVYMQAYLGGASGCTTFRASGKRYGILNAAAVEDVAVEPEESEDDFIEEGGACYFDLATGLRTCE